MLPVRWPYLRYKIADTGKKSSAAEAADEGSELVIMNIDAGKAKSLNNISEWKWSKNGKTPGGGRPRGERK